MDETNGGKSESALRLALSYRDKARILSREAGEAFAAGRIQEAEHARLQEFYARHAQHAEDRIARLQQEHQRRADGLHESIQSTARRQAELADLASARDIAPHKANRLNRRYTQTIEEERARYRHEQQLASVQDVAEVGGFIDRPLDNYRAGSRERGITLPGVDRLVATAVSVLASLSVFLPWLSIAGDTRPLSGIPALLGFEERVGSGSVVALLVVFLVCPLVAAAFAWLENPRRSASGMITTGLAMLAITALALLGAGMLGDDRALLPELIRGLRLGAFLYVVAAVQLMLLGMRRARAGDPRTQRGGVLIAFTGIIVAVAVLAIAFYLNTGGEQATLRFSFSEPDPATGTVRIFVRNDGNVPANVYAPWPEGRGESISAAERSRTFGFDLYVRETDAATFRLYPSSQDCWRQNGQSLAVGTPVQVLQDTETQFELLPFAARQGGVNPQAVRITATNGNGKASVSFEATVPATPR
ncbi:MAG: hypothetical protein RBU21_06485 [FCB group bacterium]|jgi:hypothetical protein|nr:hypothetical protein [FCB group bacterium]